VSTPPLPDEADEAAETDDDAAPGRRRPSRRALSFVVVPLVGMVIMNSVGDALATTLVDTHPAVLIALNARNRNLILVTNQLDAWTYYGVGAARLLLSDPLFFLLGMWYGDSAVVWMEKRTNSWGQMLRGLQNWFGKAAYPLIFLAPNNPICLFAGAAGMPLRAFFAVNLAGTVARLWLIRRFGEAFERPIDDVIGFIRDYRIPLLVLSVVLVFVSIGLEAKRGETEIGSLTRLDDEIDDIEGRKGSDQGTSEGAGTTPGAGADS
jgi:membrane protein DedA with SNARE-associated domain